MRRLAMLLVAAFCFFTAPAWSQTCSNTVVGSFTCVRNATNNAASHITSVTYAGGYTVGQLIIVAVEENGGNAWAGGNISNTNVYTWTFGGDAATGGQHIGLYYAKVPSTTAGSDTITATNSNASGTLTVLDSAIYSGVNAIDGAGISNSGSSTSLSSGAYTVTVGDLNIGFGFAQAGTLAVGSGWNNRENDTGLGGGPYTMLEDQSAASSSATATFTASSGGWVVIAIAFTPLTPPTITSANSATLTLLITNSFTVTASGNPAPTFSETGSLPSGVTLSAGGVLSGMPGGGVATYPIVITASNGNAPNATQNFTLTVQTAPSLGGQVISYPQLPQVSPSVIFPGEQTTVLTPANGAALTTALTGVTCGTTIRLTHGVTYTAASSFPFTTNCTCRSASNVYNNSQWIILESDSYAGGSVRGNRIDPSLEDSKLATITNTSTTTINATDNGAGCYWLLGVDLTNANTGAFALINWGDESSSSFPHDLVIDHVYGHGIPLVTMQHCVSLQGIWQAVVDSYISDCHNVGQDTQAIFSRDGNGPHLYQNNFLEAAGENTMFGGAPSQAGAFPCDITITGNHYYKPLAWWPNSPFSMGYHPTVKDSIEFKNACRALVKGNVFDTSWQDGQAELTIFNTDCSGSPASVNYNIDITYTLNIGKNSPQAVNFGGCGTSPVTQPTTRIFFNNNLWTGIDGKLWGAAGNSYHDISLNCGGGSVIYLCAHDIWEVHETFASATANLSNGYQINLTCPQCSFGIQFRDSILDTGGNGAFGGNVIIANAVPNANFTNDCIFGGNGAVGNISNFANDVNVAAASNVFVNQASDWHVAPASACHGIASDGTDPGANINALNAATAGVIQTLGCPVTLTNISPSTFTHTGGTGLTLTGTCFQNESGLVVAIGGAGPPVTTASDSCGSQGQFTVSTETDSTHFKYSADACVVVTNAPITLAVNDTVNVYFTGGAGAAYVENVNRYTPGNACTSVMVASSTTITCNAPAATGTVTTGPVSVFVSQWGIPVQSTVFGNYN